MVHGVSPRGLTDQALTGVGGGPSEAASNEPEVAARDDYRVRPVEDRLAVTLNEMDVVDGEPSLRPYAFLKIREWAGPLGKRN